MVVQKENSNGLDSIVEIMSPKEANTFAQEKISNRFSSINEDPFPKLRITPRKSKSI